MANKNPIELANEIQRPQVDFYNKNAFLKKYGLDKYYEFDGGDLWNINEDENDEDANGMTGIRVGYGSAPRDEEELLKEIESLGRWKRSQEEQAPVSKQANPNADIEEWLGSQNIALDSPFATGLTDENRAFIRNLIKAKGGK